MSSEGRWAQRGLFAAMLSVLAAGAVVGSMAAHKEAQQTAERRSALAARQAAVALERLFDDVSRTLSGSQAVMASDGTLRVEVFDAFADDAMALGELWDVVLVGEQLPVADGADGDYPVLGVRSDVAGELIERPNFASDPARWSALRRAEATGRAAVSDLTALSADGERGVTVVRPLVHRVASGSDVRGFLVAGVPTSAIRDTLRDAVGASMAVTVVRDGEVLDDRFGDVEDSAAQQGARIGGEVWDVAVQPLSDPDMALAWLVGSGGGVAVLAMLTLFAVAERHERAMSHYAARLEGSEERGWAVQELTAELTRAATAEQVLSALLSGLPRAVGADQVAVGVRDDGGLAVLDSDGGNSPRLRVAATGSWLERVMSSQEPAWLHNPKDWRHDPQTAAVARSARSLAILPFASGPVAGVLVVSYGRYHILAEVERAVLSTVSLLAGRALGRGQRYDADHQAAVEFQRAALPTELPHVGALGAAARYLPATQGAAVGGDWYDAVVVDERRVLFIVGDVVGHGMAAAATMGQLRTTFRVMAALYADPDEILAAVNSHIEAAVPGAFCATAICAVVDLDEQQIHCARAGHLPALIVRPEGAELLAGTGSPPLGFIPDAVPALHTHRFEEGDMFVLYTDGLIEQPGEDIDESLHRLCTAASALGDLCPGEFCDTLVHAMAAGPGQRDDIAVLAVQRRRSR